MAKEGSTVSGLMDAFATSISLALQHGVPLRVLCEKFAHTRFEPSGWTGNEQIGYAKSLMDYIFRWLNLRFLSGEQLDAVRRAWLRRRRNCPPRPPCCRSPSRKKSTAFRRVNLPRLAEEVARRLNQVQRQHRHGQHHASPAAASRRRLRPAGAPAASPRTAPAMQDRGIYHAADAMRDMYDMGDAPSCRTCGAIMVRNGSCYRCMSCGSTSGCS